ncbi:MAG: DUF4252 domain-containing protein [Lysobacterales bacterium]|nr:MAG: DUF4252 domain-containing protein [Xanthomonadales bacterium]
MRVALAAALLLTLAGCGVTAPRGSDGYADLDSLGIADTDRVMTLSIGPALLRFAAAHVEDEPETRELLRALQGVRVHLYEIDGDAARVAERMDALSRKLQAGGWERVVLVRSENEEAHMLMKVVDRRICGMTVLVSDGKTEAVVINLMGDIPPRQFVNVMTALEVDAAGVGNVRPAGEEQQG